MIFNYSTIVNLIAQVVSQALPIGIIFYLAEMLVSFFLRCAFPKRYRDV